MSPDHYQASKGLLEPWPIRKAWNVFVQNESTFAPAAPALSSLSALLSIPGMPEAIEQPTWHQRGRGLLLWPRIWGDVRDHDHPACSSSLIPALESPCPPENLSQLSAMWYGGHGDSNAGISYMRGPNGEPGPALSIILADRYSDIDVDRGDDIVYCGSNTLDNTSSNTPADGGSPVRGNTALFKPTERRPDLFEYASKTPSG
ncbi:YDG/SRA domain-containing protein [Colletotrichum simmondsii]|uniref:YDG/SRA domain-containing protein n=1 Tax=Colletotrichum simmondsii TaxID=703756 RepID=A0A135RZ92_9PEZI|nr:YDG/SRA domain-containing protein [Colletotrichum simmondsii]